jgi:hypothetical protein
VRNPFTELTLPVYVQYLTIAKKKKRKKRVENIFLSKS